MLYGIGGMAGPLVAGVLMSGVGHAGLFVTFVVAHIALILFTLIRIRALAPVADEDKGDFISMLTGRGSTPETNAFAAEEEDETSGALDDSAPIR